MPLVSHPIRHPMTATIIKTLAVATTIVACIWPSVALSQSMPRQTIEGCGLHGWSTLNGTDDPASWSGDCVDGLAQGLGIVRRKWKGLNTNGTLEIKSMFHRGKQFGFMHIKTLLEDGEKEHWAFNWEGKSVSIQGLGLQGDDSLLSNAADVMPRRAMVLNKLASVGVTEKLTFMDASCFIDHKRFDGCGNEVGKQNFTVYFFQRGAVGHSERFFCPIPRDKASCESLAATLVAPYVAEMEAFIRANIPAVQARIVEMQGAKADSERRLNTAPVGELLAMADEYMSKGNRASARVALRKLMGRFPDHKLAGVAATMLSELQGTSP